jgi:hypothetical protein
MVACRRHITLTSKLLLSANFLLRSCKLKLRFNLLELSLFSLYLKCEDIVRKSGILIFKILIVISKHFTQT